MYKYQSYKIQFLDLFEICQGGPEVGKLVIDEKIIDNHYFHEPPLFYENFVLVPMLYRSWMSTGFKLAKVDLSNHLIRLVSKKFAYIQLKNIENGHIFFYTNTDNTIEEKLELIRII